MLEVGKRYESARTGGSIQIVERTPEKMSFERTYAPRTGEADPHYHLDFTQTWEAVRGDGAIEVDGERRDFSAGERVRLAPGTPHRDPSNPGGAEFVVRGTFEPSTDFIEAYTETWAHHMSEGTVNEQDEMPLLQILALARATNGQSYRAGVPRALQKATLPLVAVVARLRGFRIRYD